MLCLSCMRAEAIAGGLSGALGSCRAKALECVDAVLDVLYPPACGACSAPLPGGRDPVLGVLCPDCSEGLEPIGEDACPRCAAPIETARAHGSPDGSPGPRTCDDCRRLRPAFERVHAAYLYGGPLLEAVHGLKYDKKAHLARPLARLMRYGLPKLPGGADLVVPVPSHSRRVRQRGFDHAWCLARELASSLRLPTSDALRRRRDTPPQARLDLRRRLANVEGAIEVVRRASCRIRGRRVLLVDDVMTSGATAHACARALARSGAASVVVAVLARAE